MPSDLVPKIAALVVAAGKSSRMGAPKALLPINGSTFIEAITQKLVTSATKQIYVTLPENENVAAQIRGCLSRFSPIFIKNILPEREMLGSIQSLLALPEFEAEALFICPVDMPFLEHTQLRKLLDAHRNAEAAKGIFCAAFKGEMGHPLLITRKFFEPIRDLGDADTLRVVMKNYPNSVVKVECNDERVISNINTPQDYARFTNPSPNIFDAAATDAPGAKSR